MPRPLLTRIGGPNQDRAEFLAMVRVEALKAAVEHVGADGMRRTNLVMRTAEEFEEWLLRGEN